MDHISCVSPTGPLAYDRSLISDKVAATLVKPVIGEASPPHTLPEFSLISFDKSGNREPLPPGLGNLPLYLEDEGYFSVNGALDFTLFSPHTALAPVSYDIQPTIHPMINNIPHFSCESQHIAPDRHPYYLNDDTISCEPPVGTKRRSYLCHVPDCTWRASFPTKQALDRHHEVKHLNKRVDCPIPGCERVGDKGIKRKDNIPTHVWNKHGIKLPRQPHGN